MVRFDDGIDAYPIRQAWIPGFQAAGGIDRDGSYFSSIMIQEIGVQARGRPLNFPAASQAGIGGMSLAVPLQRIK